MKRKCKHCNETIHHLIKLEPAYTVWVHTIRWTNPELGNAVECINPAGHEPAPITETGK